MRNEPASKPYSQRSITPSAETATANLVGYLSELGYDPSRYEYAGLRQKPDQVKLLDLIRENLSHHEITSATAKGPQGWPHQEDVLVIKSSADKASAPLRRFVHWVEQEVPGAQVFFDPLISYMTASKGSASHWGISLPLSLAIEPQRLWHPHDPTLGHELFHLLSASLFNKGMAVVFKVDLTPKDPFPGSHPDDTRQSAEELLAHRYNLKHALGRLARSVSNTAPDAEEMDSQIAVVSEILFLGQFAAKAVELIEDYTNAMLSDERYVPLDYKPFDGGCMVKLSLPREDSSTGIAIWTRETTQDGVHRAMVDYLERLHSLSTGISEIFRDFFTKFRETTLCAHLADAREQQFCGREPETISLLQSAGNKILGLYHQNDFMLEKHVIKPNQLFDRLREALAAPEPVVKKDTSVEALADVEGLLGKLRRLFRGMTD
jgi:hypothetical protein